MMKRLRPSLVIFIFALVSQLIGCGGGGGSENNDNPGNDACSLLGLSNKELRIINGATCGNLSNSPIVRIRIINASQGSASLCTGVLVASSKLLTAAHCLSSATTSATMIYGDAGSQKSVSVSSIQIHPKFQIVESSSTGILAFNDVAVLSLSQSVSLPTLALLNGSKVSNGEIVSIYGYGVNEAGDNRFLELRSGQMKVSEVSDTHILAKYEGIGSDTCQGDSGGPAVALRQGRSVVAGLVSSGSDTQCRVGDISVFTNLSDLEVIDFIRAAAPEAAIL